MIHSKRGILDGLKKNPKHTSSYDSLLEKNYMVELEQNPGVSEWTKDHDIYIPYQIFGILPRRYNPDFLVTYLDGSKEIHETKGAGFLSWITTHSKRRAADLWCRQRNMRYRFIENSRGAMFGTNCGLDRMEEYSANRRKGLTLDDL